MVFPLQVIVPDVAEIKADDPAHKVFAPIVILPATVSVTLNVRVLA